MNQERKRCVNAWRALVLASISVALLAGTGCQTFRNSQSPLSETEKERDQQVGAVVEKTGTTFHWLSGFLSWIH